MNEATLANDWLPKRLRRRIGPRRQQKATSALQWYTLTGLLLVLGWVLRDVELISPKQGVGYWLGIAGGSLMLFLLLYPLRKRIRAFRVFGSTASWFRLHMILGIVGPMLILYHSNFHLGSFNSQVALYCMLLVAGSGIVGRHIYAGIHRGLYGEKTSLQELRHELTDSLEQSRGLGNLMPQFAAQLRVLAEEIEGNQVTGSLSIRTSIGWTVKKYYTWWRLRRTAIRELRLKAVLSPQIANDYAKLKTVSTKYIRIFVRRASRVAHFTLYERLFSLWHVLHLPLFFMMVISAIFHVLAVHMY